MTDSTSTTPKPKRFLTAYNFFFMHERNAYLDSQKGVPIQSELQPSTCSTSSTLAGGTNPSSKHADGKGKISFADLNKLMSRKWKELLPEEKKVFEDLAKKDLERYRKEKKDHDKKMREKSWLNFKSSLLGDLITDEEGTNTPIDPQHEPSCVKTNSKAHRQCPSANEQPIGQSPAEGEKHSTHSLSSSSDQKKESLINSVDNFQTVSIDSNCRSDDKHTIEDVLEDTEDITISSEAMETFTMGSAAAMSTDPSTVGQGSSSTTVVYESLSTRILQVLNKENKFGENTDFVAIKILTDQFPQPQQILRLENEYKISQQLSKCSFARRTFLLGTYEGLHALYAEWASGMTLKEWIRTTHKETKNREMHKNDDNGHNEWDVKDFDIKNAVHLASKISDAFAEMHDFGVIHNNITTDNIIIEENENCGSYSVKIIDLDLASIVTKDGCASQEIQSELFSLGSLFFELFTGANPYYCEDSASISAVIRPKNQEGALGVDNGKEVTNTTQLHPDSNFLLRSTLPLCLSSLVLNMVEKRGQSCYFRSIKEVSQELSIMLANSKYLLCDTNLEKGGKAFFLETNQLYGRDSHILELMGAFDRVSQLDGLSEIVMISGYPGAGKSALVQQARSQILEKGANFLCGKFGQLQQMKPLSVITAAFTNFFNELTSHDTEKLLRVKTAIQKGIGSDEIGVLLKVMPSLVQITGAVHVQPAEIGGVESLNSLKYIFQLLARAISTPAEPLVLFLDDLQWADPLSLNLIENLIIDAENTSFLLVGAYRNSEVHGSHHLSTMIKTIENRNTPVTKIKVGDFNEEETNELISDMIQTSPSLTKSLANVVHRKTSGNPLFILQFLRSLCDEGLLYFSLKSEQWMWDVAIIESKNIADHVIELMSYKILKLPQKIQTVLKLLACLGSYCEKFILDLIAPRNDTTKRDANGKSDLFPDPRLKNIDTIELLGSIVKEGLIDHEGSIYKFAHDLIQSASYSLIPKSERACWHLWIGNQVRVNSVTLREKALFVAVGQLNKGKELICEPMQRIELAQLNLQAGEISKSLAAFLPAAFYSKAGISLLDESYWSTHYELCLRLYDCYAEAGYCNGDFDEMKQALDIIFTNARCFDDTIHSYFTLVNALGAQGNFQEVFNVGFFVLEQLGEPIELSSVTEAVFDAEFLKTRQMLDGKTHSDILAMRPMSDCNKIATMHLMSILLMFSYCAKIKVYVVLLTLRNVQISLRYGLCNNSAFGFASYGALLGGMYSNVEDMYHFGQLSLLLLDRSQTKECLGRTYTVIYTLIHSWVEHHRASLEPLEYSYKIAMRYGDIQYAFLNAGQYCIHSFNCGVELGTIEKKMREYSQLMIDHKMEIMSKMVVVHRQVVLNLMGCSRDPTQLSGDAMDQETVLKEALQTHHIVLVCMIHHQRSWLAYLFDNFELASKMAAEVEVILEDTTGVSIYMLCHFAYLDGLISFALARSTNQTQMVSRANRSISKVKQYAEHAPSNYQHMLLLLKAESAFFLGENGSAAKMYDDAIEVAGENGFIHEQALACERAGMFYLEQGDSSKGSYYYGKAHSAYLEWGAQGKADHLRKQSPF